MNEMKLKIVYLPTESLTPYEGNAKLHTEEQIDQIVRSIEEFGMNDPIGIWGEKNLIIEGHGRLEACKKLKMKQVPCIRLDDLTDEQRRAYTLVHNKLTLNSGFAFAYIIWFAISNQMMPTLCLILIGFPLFVLPIQMIGRRVKKWARNTMQRGSMIGSKIRNLILRILDILMH